MPRKTPPRYLDWCRTKKHPASCRCVYERTDPRGLSGSVAGREAEKKHART